ncbi:hypothetical protein C206_01902 [Pseudomonas putida TRO1]|uniref:Uncharacterized protein n=1 Tax=Pseudomonas putida TRO1 TaxID=1227924 RepID=A0AAD2ZW33_PSEPU|nr:hypothetical protein C206_01902 [Pseudomonas putida TRO1]
MGYLLSAMGLVEIILDIDICQYVVAYSCRHSYRRIISACFWIGVERAVLRARLGYVVQPPPDLFINEGGCCIKALRPVCV